VAEGLRTLILGLYDRHLAPGGHGVDYASLAHDPGFRDYVTAASELTKVRGLCCLHTPNSATDAE